MDRETLSSYGFLSISLILMSMLLLLSTPLGHRVMNFTETQVNNLINISGVTQETANTNNYGTVVVHYRYNGSSNDIQTYKTTMRIGERCLVPSFNKEGYTKQILGNASAEVPSEVVVTQHLEEITICLVPKTYTIDYVLNGGNWRQGEKYKTTYTYGTEYGLPERLVKENYQFIGWFEDIGLGGEKTERIGNDVFGNKTFYAKFAML